MTPKPVKCGLNKALAGGSMNQAWIFLGLDPWFLVEHGLCLRGGI